MHSLMLHRDRIVAIIVFGVAMAALESAVVVYLRALYYPEGFTVAMRVLDESILLTELAREVATLVMLADIAFITGKTFTERFAYFMISFAVWDIFYYVWLKVFIDWPLTLWDWDILFLIPVTWLGPVAAPVVCSVTMILLGLVLLNTSERFTISRTVWTFLLMGSAVILFTFMKDYGTILFRQGFISDYANLMHNEKFIAIASTYIPESYDWTLFWFGELLIIVAIGIIYYHNVLTIFLSHVWPANR